MINVIFLKKLCSIPSPDSMEYAATDFYLNECKSICEYANENYYPFKKYNPLVYDCYRDKIGNGIVKIGKGRTKIMISAHIDEIGMLVQRIDDKGFIHFIANGGIDKKILPGSWVSILSSSDGREIPGIIGKKPVHLEWHNEEETKVTDVKDLKIDCGFESKDEAEKHVQIGDSIVIRGQQYINGNRFISYGIDDKSGVAVVVETLKNVLSGVKIQDILKKCTLYFVACVQEETTQSGAKIASKSINPDISIDFDVTFATDDDNVDKNEWGDISLGKGGCIAFGPDKNNDLDNKLRNICQVSKIPYQTFCVHGGTDTLPITNYSNSDGCKSILLSIPQRNMHTNVEVCDLRDLESLAAMTHAFLINIELFI